MKSIVLYCKLRCSALLSRLLLCGAWHSPVCCCFRATHLCFAIEINWASWSSGFTTQLSQHLIVLNANRRILHPAPCPLFPARPHQVRHKALALSQALVVEALGAAGIQASAKGESEGAGGQGFIRG